MYFKPAEAVFYNAYYIHIQFYGADFAEELTAARHGFVQRRRELQKDLPEMSDALKAEFGASESVQRRIRVIPRRSPEEIPEQFSDSGLHSDQEVPLILICWDLYADLPKHRSYRYSKSEAALDLLSRVNTFTMDSTSLVLRKEKVLSTNDKLMNQFFTTVDQELLKDF